MRSFVLAVVVATGALLPAGAGYLSGSESPASQAEAHIRKACELVWPETNPRQIELCTTRAMAALVDENQLRDNELKRLLMDSERELERCKLAAQAAARSSR